VSGDASLWLIGGLALAGLLALVWWHLKRQRSNERALSTIARGLRTPTNGTPTPRASAAGGLPPGLLASGETPAVSPRRRRAVPQRHAPYVPDAQLPSEVSALPIFRRGPHRFARNLLAAAGETHELRVFDYSASEERADEGASLTVALFRSRVLHLPELPLVSDAPGAHEALIAPVREQIERDHALVIEGTGRWLAVYHREGLVPDDKLESFVDDARRVHDLLAGVGEPSSVQAPASG